MRERHVDRISKCFAECFSILAVFYGEKDRHQLYLADFPRVLLCWRSWAHVIVETLLYGAQTMQACPCLSILISILPLLKPEAATFPAL